jgi:hypothetical protein
MLGAAIHICHRAWDRKQNKCIKNDGEGSSIDQIVVIGLQKMLDENNILAKTFRTARDRFKEEDYHEYTLKLIGKWRSGTHNLPCASEVAALVVQDPSQKQATRDIIVDFKNMEPKRISDIHPKLMSLQYPLLFPYGKTDSHLKFRIEVFVQIMPRENMSPC